MASKTKTQVKAPKKTGFYYFEWHYLIPAALGGGIAFIFSWSWLLAFQVFAAVIVGSAIGHWIAKHK